MLGTFGLSLGFVGLAEMGDKTQLLAMGLAARYRWQVVLAAVAVATILNHLLAVLAGRFACCFIPVEWIQLLAAISFLVFAVWTLHGDSAPGEISQARWGPFLTVCTAFFLAEMGDKTQLITLNLTVEQTAAVTAAGPRLAAVWLGSTAGMLLADAAGIGAGLALHRVVPVRVMRWAAALAFAAFGLYALHAALARMVPAALSLRVGLLGVLIPLLAALMLTVDRRSARLACQPLVNPERA